MAQFVKGSPPRVWGKRAQCLDTGVKRRFTPTRVGKTRNWRSSASKRSVHPHACGENACAASASVSISGSPPRVWGKLHPAWRLGVFPRFTPTRVGKTPHPSRTPPSPSVHPHACGENSRRPNLLLDGNGSPPRVWGKRCSLRNCMPLSRFTPTRVGKTRSAPPKRSGPTVHPHACGENQRAVGAQ